ncbi:TPA: BREX system Lon protease-like protein BrxL [Pseudomonas aeruginosa]|jgi:ATP-dependent Lon protease|uniref:ATP-dependent Lon protease n=1 Tax=Stutzerimonas chloritidismutans AW-1 TaxID=1263865 RepID=V4QEL1_STUCH|nr:MULTISPECIES: BREX system Lon protease-like protein BrxL [Pseudomonadota]EKW9778516.1 BREX system Lon protease-like protein BrxL [Pseudomonas aeruginosa]ESR01155.1 ATP-dependent Lon protease [Stutzerimonas chloritidismutans AW-1]MBG4776766.1 BREX system Lon protease-like protein BrxL [Pseudomonas aeruginosa]MBM2636781.1 BREX system Lon protease-like protein BrxL [Pseudomonas aeruginosa]MBM2790475.1 BREX system Lon protease-like protein BrxL [Pseudomonas aeruginosa]
MDELDQKLNATFDGKVLRKDLLHRIKKGTNVPTFVLEFLLAKYCASNDQAEMDAGMEAVLSSLQENYVRPDEANAAQSKVATKGKHRFIDKVHVRYVEKEKRHWASLENFNSQRIAIGEKFYRDNDRLLEGGIWAEVTLAHNDIDEDDYAFSIEDLRPIQLTRFDFDRYAEGRAAFTRDEWIAAVLRSVGLEPNKLSKRVQMHFIARLAALVEPNFNYIELGPRGTGKSYFFSEFSPYATLISGGQATKATLFYNNARRKVGLVGFWDTVAFDEVGGIKVKDPDTIQIMKDFMANGRFSRGAEVIADASLSFVGNIDVSVQQVVNSNEHDLFQPLPPELDLAVMDRFAAYIPGWEMPKNSSEFLTSNYGFITDYLAEAFHYQFKHTNRYEEVSKRIRLGKSIEGRDEKGIKKTVCAFLKVLHPNGPPTDEEFEEYVAYATECRRRVKEQMNKRKPDDEFARINLSYFKASGEEVVVFCPESKDAPATQEPARRRLSQADGQPAEAVEVQPVAQPAPAAAVEPPVAPVQPAPAPTVVAPSSVELKEQHFTILYGDTGYSYESILGPYLQGAKSVVIEDPYIRLQHQIQNFVRFCETVLKAGTVKKISLITGYDDKTQLADIAEKLDELKQSLLELDVELEVKLNPNIHDREIRLDNGWIIKIGRGLDFYQKPGGWFEVGANDLSLRKCLETKVDIFRA